MKTKLITCAALTLFASTLMSKPADKSLKRFDCTFEGEPSHTCNPEEFAKTLSGVRTIAVVITETVPPWSEVAATIYIDNRTGDHEYNRLRDLYFDRFLKPSATANSEVAAARSEFLRQTANPTDQKQSGTRSLNGAPLRGIMSREPIVITDRHPHLTSEFTRFLEKWGRFKVVADLDSADLVLDLRRSPFLVFDAKPELPTAGLLVWGKRANRKKDEVLWSEGFVPTFPEGDAVLGLLKVFRSHVQQLDSQARGVAIP